MKKYDISREYGIFRRVLPPFHRGWFFLSSLILSAVPVLLKGNHKVMIKKEKVKTEDGKSIPLYIFSPSFCKTDKVLLYIHGGGFAFKGYYRHYQLCERFAMEVSCKVVYVDYRLLPKYKYPVPIDDCFCAYKWILENSDVLQISPSKVMVGGDSAGGCLSVDVTVKAVQEGLDKPCSLMLLYPVLDKRMNTESQQTFTDTPMWNAKLNQRMWKAYLGNSDYISPNELSSFKEFPPTYIEVAEYDCLHDEGVEFANQLRKAGISVHLQEVKQAMHGYDIKDCSITEEAIQKRIKFLQSEPEKFH